MSAEVVGEVPVDVAERSEASHEGITAPDAPEDVSGALSASQERARDRAARWT